MFDVGEIVDLIFKIGEIERKREKGKIEAVEGLTYESISGDDKKDKILQLVLFMRRHARYREFLELLKRERPSEDWVEFS